MQASEYLVEKMCLGAGQGQARKAVQVRCDFWQQFRGELGKRTLCKDFTNTFTDPSVCVGVWWHVCGSPHLRGDWRTTAEVRPLSPPLELGPLPGWGTGVPNCRAIQLAQEGDIVVKTLLASPPFFVGAPTRSAAWRFHRLASF